MSEVQIDTFPNKAATFENRATWQLVGRYSNGAWRQGPISLVARHKHPRDPKIPLYVFFPQAKAVAAAALSVTSESEERV
jgi:hypothetical protein